MDATARVGDDEVKKVLRNKKKIEEKAKQGALAELFEDIRMMFSIVKDYFSGDYREIPFGTIAAVAGALLYVLSPIDLIPDFIPGVGLVDDAGVVVACLRLVKVDIDKYKKWKEN